jgi:hypothetical protein
MQEPGTISVARGDDFVVSGPRQGDDADAQEVADDEWH